MLDNVIKTNIQRIESVLAPNTKKEPEIDYKNLKIPRTREYWLSVEELRKKLWL